VLGKDVVSLPGAPGRHNASEVVIGLAANRTDRIPLPRDDGCPRPVTRAARARSSAGVRDETSAEDGPVARRQPGVGGQYAGGRSGEPTLELYELLVALRPSPIGWHSKIVTDAHGRPGSIALPMATLVT